MKRVSRAQLALIKREKNPKGPRREPLYVVTRCDACGSSHRHLDPAALRWARVRAGLTQQQMARFIGVDRRYVVDIEHGNRRCTPAIEACYRMLGRLDLPKIVSQEVRRATAR